MKYIVTIGSHTQFLTAVGTLNSLKIDNPQNVLILYVRKYRNVLLDLPYRQDNIFDLYELSLDAITNFRNQRRLISSLDKIIRDFVGEENFHAIVPHVATPLFQIIATNQLCVSIDFIQEGGAPLKNRFIKKTSLKSIVYDMYNAILLNHHRCWRTDQWIVPDFLRTKRRVATYDLGEYFKYMNNVDEHTIIKWPQVKVDYELNPDNPCFIFDSFMNMKCISEKDYMQCATKMIQEYAKECNYAKFHPAQGIGQKDAIKALFTNQGKKVEELPMEIPFECFIIKYPKLKIVGFLSSLLDFSKQINNHEVIELYEDLLSASDSFKRWYKINI